MKKTLFQKCYDYATKLLSVCPNQKSVDCEEKDGTIIITTHYYDKAAYNVVEISNERDLRQLKYYDKKDLAKGYLI